MHHPFAHWLFLKINLSGGGVSGRAMAFCPRKPGLNPRTDLAFLEMLSIYSHWASGDL